MYHQTVSLYTNIINFIYFKLDNLSVKLTIKTWKLPLKFSFISKTLFFLIILNTVDKFKKYLDDTISYQRSTGFVYIGAILPVEIV